MMIHSPPLTLHSVNVHIPQSGSAARLVRKSLWLSGAQSFNHPARLRLAVSEAQPCRRLKQQFTERHSLSAQHGGTAAE
jgi:hypothetical protein